MKTPAKVLASTLLLTFFYACQKEISTETGGPTPPGRTTTGDSTYLSKIYLIDSIGPVPDTQDIWTWFYDAQKRVIKITDTSFLDYTTTPPTPGRFLYEIYEYVYNGTDTIPFKTIHQTNSASLDTLTTWHSYLSSGKKLKDSSVLNTLDPFVFGSRLQYRSVIQYIHEPLRILGRTLSFSGTYNDAAITYDTATLDIAGNIILNKKLVTDSATGNPLTRIVSSMIYDNHPSPFARLSNFHAYPLFPFGETMPLLAFDRVQYNNFLYLREDITDLAPPRSWVYETEDYTGFFQYRPDGYPVAVRYTDPSAPGEVFKTIYVYRSF